MNTETKRGVVDRIEEGWAIIYLLDQPNPIHIEQSRLPAQVKEGDYIQLVLEGDDRIISITVDDEATEAARIRIQAKVERLRRGEHLRPNQSTDNTEDSPS